MSVCKIVIVSYIKVTVDLIFNRSAVRPITCAPSNEVRELSRNKIFIRVEIFGLPKLISLFFQIERGPIKMESSALSGCHILPYCNLCRSAARSFDKKAEI